MVLMRWWNHWPHRIKQACMAHMHQDRPCSTVGQWSINSEIVDLRQCVECTVHNGQAMASIYRQLQSHWIRQPLNRACSNSTGLFNWLFRWLDSSTKHILFDAWYRLTMLACLAAWCQENETLLNKNRISTQQNGCLRSELFAHIIV